jgi:hypothetical protein
MRHKLPAIDSVVFDIRFRPWSRDQRWTKLANALEVKGIPAIEPLLEAVAWEPDTDEP